MGKLLFLIAVLGAWIVGLIASISMDLLIQRNVSEIKKDK